MQKEINKQTKGLNSLIVGNLLFFLGFGLNFLRYSQLDQIVSFLGNVLFIMGLSFFYKGILNFIGSMSNKITLLIFWISITLILFYFSFINFNESFRSIVTALSITVFSFKTSQKLFYSKKNGTAQSVNFVSFIFLLNAVLFAAYAILSAIAINHPENREKLIISIFFTTFILALLWTTGFIIMINQQLYVDSIHDKKNLEKILDTSNDGVMIISLKNFLITKTNKKFEDITLFREEDCINSSIYNFKMFNSYSSFFNLIGKIIEDINIYERELSFSKKNGDVFTGLLSGKKIKIQGDDHIIFMIQDISRRKEAEAIRMQNEIRLQKLVDIIKKPTESISEYLEYALNHAIKLTDSQFGEIFIYNESENAFVPKSANVKFLHDLTILFDTTKSRSPIISNDPFPLMTIPIFKKNRIEGIVALKKSFGTYNSTDALQTYLLMDSVWSYIGQKEYEEKIRHLAQYDVLTDLPNRGLFNDRLSQAILVAKRDKYKFAILCLDLDKFKPVNDNFGHNTGDKLLKQVAIRMKGCIRESDTVARVGGDEFFIILTPSIKSENAYDVASKIKKSLNEIFIIDNHKINISSSIGICFYPKDGETIGELTENCDKAMYHAKESGRNIIKYFSQEYT